MDIKEHYQKNVIPAMQEKFGYKNRLAVPRLVKVVVGAGISSGLKDQKAVDTVKDTLRVISGQEPSQRKAKKSVAGFKIRQGQVVGLMVTLRGKRMYDFLERLVNLTFPRMRDFRGLLAKGLDEHGNFTVGLHEAVAFPEIKAGDAQRQHGLEVTVVTTAKNKQEGLELLRLLGFPFRKE